MADQQFKSAQEQVVEAVNDLDDRGFTTSEDDDGEMTPRAAPLPLPNGPLALHELATAVAAQFFAALTCLNVAQSRELVDAVYHHSDVTVDTNGRNNETDREARAKSAADAMKASINTRGPVKKATRDLVDALTAASEVELAIPLNSYIAPRFADSRGVE